ncbi:MAG TPA: carboxypeptidase regulatory-like domain-containing protein [Gemmatimonadaceae bacterium]|nr:carboxypeptidase regulatory-like domain-containing protein [Gemmatimonadaceae bacterium]
MYNRCAAALLLFTLTSAAGAVAQSTQSRTDVPVRKVMLFSSGVGYFEHAGSVRGDGLTELRFKTAQINDILKSLVLQDLDGGRVSNVTYPSQDPISKTLRSFQIDITDNPSLADLLNQLRGAKVTVQSQGERLSGTVLGVEIRRKSVASGEPVETPVLNVLSGAMIRAVDLPTITSLSLDDPQLQDELTKALVALTQARDQDKKPVTINFAGNGDRRVRIGYVVETPVWKTSYRLLLDDKTPKLQGWAIVENQTESDWNDVSLSLVSGRPISFMMDLYSPLYSQRPFVVQELFAGLRPQMYGAGIGARLDAAGRIGGGLGTIGGVVRDKFTRQPIEGVQVFVQGGAYGTTTKANGTYTILGVPPGTYTVIARLVGYAPLETENVVVRTDVRREINIELAQSAASLMAQKVLADSPPLIEQGTVGATTTISEEYYALTNAASSVQAIAAAAQLGELFQYSIPNVTLARQKSAMLPIVTDSIAIDRVSIYNATVLARNPLNGVRLKNITGKHLLQGPVTVLDQSSYAGDARIDNVPPGQERLLSYGVDLDVVVDNTKNSSTAAIVTGRIDRGTLTVTRKFVTSREYLIDNKGDRDKQLVIEHPIRAGWKLVDTLKPLETTATLYRFQRAAAAKKVTTFAVKEESVQYDALAMLNADVAQLLVYQRTGEIPAAVRDAIAKAVQLKQAVTDTERQLADRTRQIADITAEQNRMRENMRTTGSTTQYYQRLLSKLNEQESTIERLQAERDALTKQRDTHRQALDAYLNTLTIG